MIARISSGSGSNKGPIIINSLAVSSADVFRNKIGNRSPVRITAYGKTEVRFSYAYRVPYGILSIRQRLTLLSKCFLQEQQRTSEQKIKTLYRKLRFRRIFFPEINQIWSSAIQIFLY